MKTNLKIISCIIIIFGIIMFKTNLAQAGAPEGLWESIPPDVRGAVVVFLRQEGLCLECDRLLASTSYEDSLLRSKTLENEITTYLLHNRDLLTMAPISTQRKVDVLVCMMFQKEGRGLDYYRGSAPFNIFCSLHLK